jgi:hypothetical protein
MQQLRSDLLIQQRRMSELEGQLQQATEQAAVYKEAYETGREVHTSGHRHFTVLAREVRHCSRLHYSVHIRLPLRDITAAVRHAVVTVALALMASE